MPATEMTETADAKKEAVEHPVHYGGDTVYETWKVIDAWDLNFFLGNAVKYISRAGKKGDPIEDLRKAAFYLQKEIQRRESRQPVVLVLDAQRSRE